MFKMKFIAPGPIEPDILRTKILSVIEREKRDCQKLLEQTVRGWNNPPQFKAGKGFTRGANPTMSVNIELTGDEEAIKHWNWADQGVAPHAIYPKPENKTGRLHYQKDFVAKTHQGSYSSSPSGGKRGEWTHPRAVLWKPREAGRHWREKLHNDRWPSFVADIQRVLREGMSAIVNKANANSRGFW